MCSSNSPTVAGKPLWAEGLSINVPLTRLHPFASLYEAPIPPPRPIKLSDLNWLKFSFFFSFNDEVVGKDGWSKGRSLIFIQPI